MTSPPESWPEAGENGSGTALRTPRLDLFAWLAAAFGSSVVGIPLTQVALAARAPLLVRRAGLRGLEAWVARRGPLLACVPTGPLLVLAVVVVGTPAQPWGAVAAVAAAVAAAGIALLGRHATRLEAPDRRWIGALTTAALRVGAATWLSLALSAFAQDRQLGALPVDVTDRAVGLLALGIGDLLLSAVAAALAVSALRAAVPLRRPAPPVPPVKVEWPRILDELDFDVDVMSTGALARGTISGFDVQVDVLEVDASVRLTVRVATGAPALGDLTITARGDQDADVALADPILSRMVRVSGVTPAEAADLLGDAHEPLFAVLHGHPAARVGGGSVTAIAEPEGRPPNLADLDKAFRDATALARHLVQRVGGVT